MSPWMRARFRCRFCGNPTLFPAVGRGVSCTPKDPSRPALIFNRPLRPSRDNIPVGPRIAPPCHRWTGQFFGQQTGYQFMPGRTQHGSIWLKQLDSFTRCTKSLGQVTDGNIVLPQKVAQDLKRHVTVEHRIPGNAHPGPGIGMPCLVASHLPWSRTHGHGQSPAAHFLQSRDWLKSLFNMHGPVGRSVRQPGVLSLWASRVRGWWFDECPCPETAQLATAPSNQPKPTAQLLPRIQPSQCQGGMRTSQRTSIAVGDQSRSLSVVVSNIGHVEIQQPQVRVECQQFMTNPQQRQQRTLTGNPRIDHLNPSSRTPLQ